MLGLSESGGEIRDHNYLLKLDREKLSSHGCIIFSDYNRWYVLTEFSWMKNQLFQVHHFPNCTDFLRSQSTGPADWVPESSAYHFFDFHLLSIAQTFVPFIVLVAFNFVSILVTF